MRVRTCLAFAIAAAAQLECPAFAVNLALRGQDSLDYASETTPLIMSELETAESTYKGGMCLLASGDAECPFDDMQKEDQGHLGHVCYTSSICEGKPESDYAQRAVLCNSTLEPLPFDDLMSCTRPALHDYGACKKDKRKKCPDGLQLTGPHLKEKYCFSSLQLNMYTWLDHPTLAASTEVRYRNHWINSKFFSPDALPYCSKRTTEPEPRTHFKMCLSASGVCSFGSSSLLFRGETLCANCDFIKNRFHWVILHREIFEFTCGIGAREHMFKFDSDTFPHEQFGNSTCISVPITPGTESGLGDATIE